jgi:hypothetical protein
MKIKKAKLVSILGSIGLTTSMLTGCANTECECDDDDIDVKVKKQVQEGDDNHVSSGGTYIPASNNSKIKSSIKVSGSKGIGSARVSAGS